MSTCQPVCAKHDLHHSSFLCRTLNSAWWQLGPARILFSRWQPCRHRCWWSKEACQWKELWRWGISSPSLSHRPCPERKMYLNTTTISFFAPVIAATSENSFSLTTSALLVSLMQKASRGKGCDLFFNMATGDLSVPARLIVVWIQNTESLSLTERFLTIIGVCISAV